jgi:hypothetical protein
MHINRLVERFLQQSGMPPTTFGRLAANDPRLVFDMRNGRELGSNLADRVREFMSGYRDAHCLQERIAA